VRAHAVQGVKGAEEMGPKLQAVVRGDVERNAVLREYVSNEGICNVDCSYIICSWNEDTFLR
jgi:hypothetical protein